MKTQLHRALAFVHAAIEDPTDEALCAANQHAAEVLEQLGATVPPELRAEITQLTIALRTLRQVLETRPAAPIERALVMRGIEDLSQMARRCAT